MITARHEGTNFSPHSETDDSEYQSQFTTEELEEVERQAQEIIPETEFVIPLIPEHVVELGVHWYAVTVFNSILNEMIGEKKEFTLQDLKDVLSDYVITYNLKGGKWFAVAFQRHFNAIAQNRFNHNQEEVENLLPMEAIRVTSSSGKMDFDEPQAEIWNPEKIKGKHLISLDDIGDRGVTQQLIKKLAEAAGAKSVTTVNLIETDQDKEFSPDVALFRIDKKFVIGGGLDNGINEETRTFCAIVILCIEEPEFAEIYFRGGVAIENHPPSGSGELIPATQKNNPNPKKDVPTASGEMPSSFYTSMSEQSKNNPSKN